MGGESKEEGAGWRVGLLILADFISLLVMNCSWEEEKGLSR